MFRLRVRNKNFPQKLFPRKAHFCLVAVRRQSLLITRTCKTLRINQSEHRYQDSCSGASALRRRAWRRGWWWNDAGRVSLSRQDRDSKRKAEDRHGGYLA